MKFKDFQAKEAKEDNLEMHNNLIIKIVKNRFLKSSVKITHHSKEDVQRLSVKYFFGKNRKYCYDSQKTYLIIG